MSFLLILLTVLLSLVYLFSIIALVELFVDNDISVGLWSLLVVLLPIVNTIFVIKYNKKLPKFFDCFSIKKFLKEIENLNNDNNNNIYI